MVSRFILGLGTGWQGSTSGVTNVVRQEQIIYENDPRTLEDQMTHDGRAVANFVLDHTDRLGASLTNLSLQKLVYFCHVWSLIGLHKPLIRHSFEAWECGPVLQYLYREFKNLREFGNPRPGSPARPVQRPQRDRVVRVR